MQKMQRTNLINLEGRNVVLEALLSGRHIEKIFIDNFSEDSRIQKILNISGQRRIPVEKVEGRHIEEISETGSSQGVIALAEKIKTYSSNSFLKETTLSRTTSVVILRQLNYEHNVGAIIRTCAGAGIEGVVLPKTKTSNITPIVERVSMGGINEVKIIEESFYSALKVFKDDGFKLVALEVTGEKIYYEEDFTFNTAFIIGGESETLDEKILEKVDSTVKIPMMSNVSSLNVSVASGVLLYERLRQLNVKI